MKYCDLAVRTPLVRRQADVDHRSLGADALHETASAHAVGQGREVVVVVMRSALVLPLALRALYILVPDIHFFGITWHVYLP